MYPKQEVILIDTNSFPTKGNLMKAKNTLALSRQGYDLLDKKRNVLIREIMKLNDQASQIQNNIDRIFAEAYDSLQRANIDLGISTIESFSHGVPEEDSVNIKIRSIMGVEIPKVTYNNGTKDTPVFAFSSTSVSLDVALQKFNAVKDLIVELSMVENSAYRLAINIKKTQKRANALKNVTIPKYEALVKQIQETLEERERDEFTRLKVIKKA